MGTIPIVPGNPIEIIAFYAVVLGVIIGVFLLLFKGKERLGRCILISISFAIIYGAILFFSTHLIIFSDFSQIAQTLPELTKLYVSEIIFSICLAIPTTCFIDLRITKNKEK